MLSALSPARRRFVGGLLALLVVAVVVVGGTVAVRSLRAGATEVTPVAQDAQPPVLLVPGTAAPPATSSRSPPRSGRRDATRRSSTSRATAPATSTCRPACSQAAVQDALARRRRSVDIVGYSAGGVTARLWLRAYDGGSVARRIVTLGSPQHGTDLAALAADVAPDSCPEACRQLATDSDLVRSLNSGDETPAGPRWVSIWTTDDRVSTPPETASLDGALDFSVQSVCAGRQVTHGQLPTDPAVMAMVARRAAAYAAGGPAASVCSACLTGDGVDQSVMSLVTKLAQAAPRKTTT